MQSIDYNSFIVNFNILMNTQISYQQKPSIHKFSN